MRFWMLAKKLIENAPLFRNEILHPSSNSAIRPSVWPALSFGQNQNVPEEWRKASKSTIWGSTPDCSCKKYHHSFNISRINWVILRSTTFSTVFLRQWLWPWEKRLWIHRQNTTHGRHTWTPFCPTTWKQRPLGSCNRDGRIAQKQIFCFIISNIVHSRYEDFDFAYQLPDLDISNLNFMARRELFLSEDKREFTTNLVTLNGRLNIDLGNYAGISLNIRAVSWIFFRVNHSWCHPWRWSCARAWVLLRWFPTSLRWDRLRPWRRCCDSDCGSKADLANGYGIIGAKCWTHFSKITINNRPMLL